MTEEIPTEDNNQEKNAVLLIDLENCPAQVHQLQENLEHYHQVIICYAHSNTKVPLNWLMPLSTMINTGRLKIFQIPNSGKNAADFGISFYAGMLVQELAADVKFEIISNDKDLDHVVSLLKTQDRSAERIGIKKEEKPVVDEPETTLSPIQIYCEHLIRHSANRPRKKETLLNSIKSKFKETPQAATEVMRLLTAHNAVQITETQVSYNNKKILALADNKISALPA